MGMRHGHLAAHLGVQCIHAFVCITKPVWVDQSPKDSVLSRGPGTPSYRRKTCPNQKTAVTDSQKYTATSALHPHKDKQPGNASKPSRSPNQRANKSVSQNRLQIWPLQSLLSLRPRVVAPLQREQILVAK